MSYKIELDVNDAVDNLYPALSESQRDLLAQKIHQWWDYSAMMSEFIDVLHEVADSNAIDLEGKDGYIEDEPDRFNRDAGSIARQRLVNNNIHVLNPPNSALFP